MIRITILLAVAAAASLAQTVPAPPAAGGGSRIGAGGRAAPVRKPASAAPLPAYNDLKYPELRPFAVPAVESITLSNGLRLYLLEDHEMPLINGTVMVRTGSLFDPPDKIGLAAIAAQVMVNGGTTNRPGDDLSRRFQDLGAELAGSVTENTASISFSALKENGDEVLDILKDALTAPAFPQDRLDLVKAQMRNTIAHRNDDEAIVLRREFAATVYGKDTPYGAHIEYTNLDRINRGDLAEFHQRYFFPKNVMLALDGDFDTARMKTRVEALFGDWKSDQPPVPEFPKASTVGAPGKYLVVKKDTRQAFFAVGQVGGDYLEKDYAALEIMTGILGGGPRARLNQRLRDAAYGLSANWDAGYGHPGLFEIRASVNPFRATQAIQAVLQELVRIRTAEVTDEELKTAKDMALNSLVFAFDGQMSMLPRLTLYEYFGYPKDYTERHRRALESVTRADVLRVAKERLDPGKMTVVVVANPTAFELPLESLGGAVTPIDLTIPPPKPEAVLGDPASQRRGKQLLARAQQAMGGAGKLAAVTDYVQEIAYQFDASAGGAQATVTERWVAPGYLRQDSTTPTGKFSVYSDGKTGWVASAQGSGSAPLVGVGLKQTQGDLFRVLFSLLTSDRIASRKVNSLDDRTVEISDGAGQISKLVFDPGTGLLQSILYDASTADGQVSVIDTYSDYRDVGGIKLPFKGAITLAGRKFQDATIRNIQLNTGLKIQDLEKRP
jgi:predicted Zn-dependent peptidase